MNRMNRENMSVRAKGPTLTYNSKLFTHCHLDGDLSHGQSYYFSTNYPASIQAWISFSYKYILFDTETCFS